VPDNNELHLIMMKPVTEKSFLNYELSGFGGKRSSEMNAPRRSLIKM